MAGNMENMENMENKADISDMDESCVENICQIRRTVRMLDLAAARVSYALHDGNESVDTLIKSFTNMTEQVMSMQKGIENLPDSDEKTALLGNCSQAMNTVQETTMAFQFYDRLSQRMQHISISLDELSTLIDSPEKMGEPNAWLGLEDKIRSHYTLDNDLAMFEAVLAGENIEDILSKATEVVEDDGDIELF
ncbi:MAG: hypothetical protein KAT25_07765 [Sulfuriflexus sp.]|nr:hypothetical protein [Sulfuriflexus sp.]